MEFTKITEMAKSKVRITFDDDVMNAFELGVALLVFIVFVMVCLGLMNSDLKSSKPTLSVSRAYLDDLIKMV